MTVSPAVQKLCHSSDEWFISRGALGITTEPEDDHLLVNIFPAVREIIGGKRCGKRVYSTFFIEMGHLRRVFDQPPSIQFDSGVKGVAPFLYVRGTIDGEPLVICIMSRPPAYTPAAEHVHEAGKDKGRIDYQVPHVDEIVE